MIALSLISKTKIAKYALLPGFKSRFGELFTSGFQHIPFFIALVYQTVKLLPANHPYGDSKNIGKFGVRNVIAEAANNLVIKKENIDQLVLFTCILLGLALILIQLCLLGVGLIWQPAAAAVFSFDWFSIKNPSQDIASIMMDLVFGVPDMFNSCVSTITPCLDLNGNGLGVSEFATAGPLSADSYTTFPFPMHLGLQHMFLIYSSGLLVVAVMITVYFITAILAETAQTGTPFGKRYNKVWAPIRIAVAFGLLVPISNGLNTSQYIVLYSAKLGSAFATNGWNLFNETLGDAFLGDVKKLVSQPNSPDVTALVEFFFLARTCYYLEGQTENIFPKMYLVKPAALGADSRMEIDAFTSYEDALKFTQDSADGPAASVLRLRFGISDDDKYNNYDGHVQPTCGEVTIKLSDPRIPGSGPGLEPEPALHLLQAYYWFVLKDLWHFNVLSGGDAGFGLPNYPEQLSKRSPKDPDPNAMMPTVEYRGAFRKFYEYDLAYILTGAEPSNTNINGIIEWIAPPLISSTPAIALMAESSQWNLPTLLAERGWGAAGIWYNRIAEMNGAVTESVFNIPSPTKLPRVMEMVKEKKEQYSQSTDIKNKFSPELAKDLDIYFDNPKDEAKASVLNTAYKFWHDDGGLTTSHNQLTGNIIIDTINLLIGTDGLYSMRKNADVHPLAQLVGVGKSLVNSSIRNVGWAGVGTLATMLAGKGEAVNKVFSGFLVTLATIGLTIGFILYYVVPFLPFIYFFFALGGWIKGIFEAMVGAPLWALAHIRIDGEGLSGSAAMNGYLLILEIFLRPILIIFGMIASITIFSALISVLNQTFDLVTANLAGFDASCEANPTDCGPDATFTQIAFYRGPIDEFFFTVIYTLIVYTMCVSCFKLIDQIPNNILRWMGQSIPSFNDSREDPTTRMIGAANTGAQQGLRGLGQGVSGFLK